MTIRIEVRGADEAIRRIVRVGSLDLLAQSIERQTIRIEAAMKEYPPARAGSSYVRTGTLGRRWTYAMTRTIDSVRGTVGNNTYYGPWVQSRRFQSDVHRRRWQTDEDVVERMRPEIVRDLEASIQQAINT